ncbi:MAG: imidazole glycerol phosphate synthase subunit HisH [Dehalococcoidia bacterium]|nr:imidazole glycerol phosphate synthase subunit HisH [Dehalococcoidia bacterium]
MIAVIDYGAGNIRSVSNALLSLGCMPLVTRDPAEVLKARAIIFPGVGAAADTMRSLSNTGLDTAIRQAVIARLPLMAICVGMQVLFSYTEEDGINECLNIVPGSVRRLPEGRKVPHMGWNQVQKKIDHPMFEGIPDNSNFYFVHSYYPAPANNDIVAGTTEYGLSFCSMIVRDSIIATQFHPEKSGQTGLRMYANFLRLAGEKAARAPARTQGDSC